MQPVETYENGQDETEILRNEVAELRRQLEASPRHAEIAEKLIDSIREELGTKRLADFVTKFGPGIAKVLLVLTAILSLGLGAAIAELVNTLRN